MDISITFFKVLLYILPLIIFAGFLTYVERKVIAKAQRRIGPNITGYRGILQPIADIIKLLCKEVIIPAKSNKFLFFIGPVFVLVPALMSFAVIPVYKGAVFADLNLGLLYLLAVSSLGIYGMIFTAWGSNSNYSILGGLRAISQLISYEIPMGFIFLTVGLVSGSFNLTEIVDSQTNLWHIIPLLPIFPVFMLVTFAKTHRAPFDLPESENELVAGFNTEYSSSLFAMIFLGEYVNLVVFSALGVLIFFGGWHPVITELDFIPPFIWFFAKLMLIIIVFFFARATLPRIRFDRLIRFSWKFLIPISMFYFMLVATYMQFFRGLV